MKKETLIRIGFLLFLFAIGYLVGGGISKTIKYMAGKSPAQAAMNIPVTSKNKI